MTTENPSLQETRDHLIEHCHMNSVHYLDEPDLVQQADFAIGNERAEQLVIKNEDDTPTELILCGIFQISHEGYFLTSDAWFSPDRDIAFKDVKPSCKLIPCNIGKWKTPEKETNLIFQNIANLERIKLPDKVSITSCIQKNRVPSKSLIFSKFSSTYISISSPLTQALIKHTGP
jgi:hypothetical protein